MSLERGAEIKDDHVLRAARNHSPEMLALLFKYGAKARIPGVLEATRNRRALCLLLENGAYSTVPILQFSIDYGTVDVPFVVEHAEPTKTKAFATYALSYAASKNKLSTKLLDKLLELRANINWPEKTKLQTCLHAAASFSNAEMVRALLQRGAKCDVRNKNDQTPLHLALRKKGRPDLRRRSPEDDDDRSEDNQLETARALLEGNAEVDSVCLDLATQTGDDELIRILTERHAADATRYRG
ncbi:hypothetical protein HK405_004491 [Cladochytrium tenue]|nr:hypothetical protein HK405_004491 [Cladochytrium tenue]